MRRLSALRTYELLCRVAARAHAVRYADAAIGVAGERETGQLLPQAFYAFQPIEMPDRVLRHRGLPFVDPGEQGLGAQAENLLKFIAHDPNNLIVAQRPDTLRISSRKKTTQQSAIFW